jgi:hypothetical protein
MSAAIFQHTSLHSLRTLCCPSSLPVPQNTGFFGNETRGATLLGKWLKPKTVKSSYIYGVCPTSTNSHAIHGAML